MSKAQTAALFSAFIFPGSGHLYLKKNIQGIILAGVTVVCLYFLLVNVYDMAQTINAQIMSGEIPLNIVSVTEAVVKQVENSQLHQLNIFTISLVLFWIISIFDSYRLGRIADAKEELN